MNYAAAVEDWNGRYFDDAADEGVVAPPMFAVAVTWPLVTGIQKLLGGVVPVETMGRLVHAAESLVFHHPIRPGVTLVLGGEVVAFVPTRAGALMTLRFDAAEKDGTPIFTERVGALFRGVSCDSVKLSAEKAEEAGLVDTDAPPAWTAEIPVSRCAAHVYDGCTDIVFPIHTSRTYALKVGLPDIILQGTATLALAAREIVNRECNSNPACLRELSGRFTGMVVPGQTIRVQCWRGGNGRVAFKVLNDRGEASIDGGAALLVED